MGTARRITPEVVEELKAIQRFLETRHSDEPAALAAVLAEVNVQMARTGFLQAEAQADLDEAMADVFAENKNAILKMPATVSTKFIGALCKDEGYYLKWIERMNRACTHHAENLRSLLSYAKESSRVSRYADNVMSGQDEFPDEQEDDFYGR